VRIDAAGEAVVLPSLKPVEMLADAIRESTDPGAIVLDAFCGSGTFLLAAEKTARLARAIEPRPKTCDAVIERWQTFSGRPAFLAKTGESFDEVAKRRGTKAHHRR
jgi:DNA modification methylase